MYTKQEASLLRQEFWTTFGRYMSPVLSAEGEAVNWINYKTGEHGIVFKMEADNEIATIAIVISHPDEGIRKLYFEQFVQLRTMLLSEVGEGWHFTEDNTILYGKAVSAVYAELNEVNIFNKQDWPALISFFKQRMIALDAFWSNARYAFESLR